MADSMRDQGFSTGRIQAEVRKLLNKDAAFQAEVAKNTLEYKEEVRKIIAETEEEALKAGDLLTAAAGDMSFRYDLEAWNQPGADVTKPSNLSQIISAIQKQTRGELKNITQSMAFKNTPFETTGVYNAYRREMDLAIMKIGTGTWSWDQAAKDCVHRLAKSGLRSIDYTKDGKTRAYQLDTSVRMCLRTGMNQLAGKIQEENMKQFDTPLVYVDAHAGARPEHAVWQGKVYAYNPNGQLADGRKAGEVYGDFFSETDYGSVTGLMGVNCAHHWYPYHEGDAIPEFKEPEPVEIDGKTYTYYEATQEMRKQEREIRAQKREIEATQALGQDTTTLAAQLKGMQSKYRSFSAAAGINPRNSALRVEYGTSNLAGTKAWSSAKTVDGSQSVIYNMYRKEANTNALTKDYTEPIQGKHANIIAQEMGINLKEGKYTVKHDAVLIGSGFLGYTSPKGKMYLYPDAFKDRETLVKTIAHELEHREQIRKFGIPKTSAECIEYENQARSVEEGAWNDYKKRTNYRQPNKVDKSS